ncbi:SixA phosphatase family protein [Agaribacterium haliotis]|uniref:SixA phosphatase family protein n=1 Tax=Agaribacterium haliotis TaxID=2013869 RepID=UPI000BB577D8|nr:histidine phosphatase family protein [Agaribacterium haliotis]
MLKLTLLRHAKSSWAMPALSDVDRPLKKRGYENIDAISQRFISSALPGPSLILSSPAVRALTTAHLFSDKLGYQRNDICVEQSLYESSAAELYRLLTKQHDKFDHLLVVGHNPSITYAAIELCHLDVSNVPTCGLVHMQLHIDSWKQLTLGCGELRYYDYPKKALAKNATQA